MTLSDTALWLAETGLPVFPCNANKRPVCATGHLAASTDPDEVRRLFSLPGAALIGVPTGPRSGIDVLDLDPRHGSDDWQEVSRVPAGRTHRTGGGGTHHLFRAEPGLRGSVSRIAPGVDVRADGGYVVWWEQEPLLVVLPDWPVWLLAAAMAPTRSANGSTAHIEKPPSLRAVVDLLDELPNPADTTRTDWTAVMLAAVSCAQAIDDPDGRIADAACRWAARWPGSDGYDAEMSKWEVDWSLRDKGLAGWRNLVARASRTIEGFGARMAARDFEPLPPLPYGTTMRSRFMHPADCAAAAPRGYVIKHFIAPGDVTAIVGPPGCGKSMLAPYLGYMVAQGKLVFGLRTKQGRTLYVAAEDATGMQQRVHALKLTHGDAPDFAMAPCNNLRDEATAVDLQAAVRDWQPALVVIDTLGAAFAGLDENSAQDMGQVVALARTIAATGPAVVLIHHIAKHGDGSPRGHSVLNGTLDMSLSLAPKDDGGVIRGTLLKNRSGTTDRTVAFKFIAVPLGVDEDGDAVTAPMAVELDPSCRVAAPPKLPPLSVNALDILRAAKADAEGWVEEQDWRDDCDAARLSLAAEPAIRFKSISRAIRSLLDAKRIEPSGTRFRALEPSGTTLEPSGTGRNQAGTKRNQTNAHASTGTGTGNQGVGTPGSVPFRGGAPEFSENTLADMMTGGGFADEGTAP